MLRIIDLVSGYGPIDVLHDINIDFKDAKIVSVLGANGAGKSTLLKTISHIVKPKRGSIIFDGVDITHFEPSQIAKIGIAHVPEGRHIFPNLSVKENLLVGGYFRNKFENEETLNFVFELFPVLKERINQEAGTLSGGEAQMLAIGRGLMAKPKLLLLDEPSLGLAPKIISEIFHVIRKLADGTDLKVLLVEQNARKALDISDYAYILVLGRIALHGPPLDLKENDEVKKLYLGGKYV
ncbi:MULTISPECIES: ABC transporter ATP-binding protein [Caldisericum]|jgi:branched-chain amino acid transport system ATP-binding protein|uniref:ABC transporter ATP-binding protein n=1 Tax=Caldisericum TaxID=693074 RepID=UPI0039FD91AF